MKNKLYILNGIHMAGKSSVGKYLSDNGFFYYRELATDLFESGHKIGLNSGLGFQYILMEKEHERDLEIKKNTDVAVIESWYFSNYAHISLIDKESCKTVESIIERKKDDFDINVLYLDLDANELLNRHSKIYDIIDQKLIDYYRRIDYFYKESFNKTSVDVTYFDAEDTLENVCLNVLNNIQKS
jgi:thymidylate kinase